MSSEVLFPRGGGSSSSLKDRSGHIDAANPSNESSEAKQRLAQFRGENLFRSNRNADESRVEVGKSSKGHGKMSLKEASASSKSSSKSPASPNMKLDKFHKKVKSDQTQFNMDVTEEERQALKGIAIEAPKFVESLKYSNVEKGMQLLGTVISVHESYAILSLANGLKGKLEITHYSDILLPELLKYHKSDLIQQQKRNSGGNSLSLIGGADFDEDENAESSESDFSTGSDNEIEEDDNHEQDADFDKNTPSNMDIDDKEDDSEEKEVIKSPPHNLASLLSVGDFIRVTAVSSKDEAAVSKFVLLSSKESLLNSAIFNVHTGTPSIQSLPSGSVIAGSIKSREDHGYIVSVGYEGFSAFVAFEDINGFENPNEPVFFVGQRLDFNLKAASSSKTKNISLTLDGKHSRKLISPEQVTTVDSLCAGMLVKASVAQTIRNGLWLSFLDYFNGSVDINHVQTPLRSLSYSKKAKRFSKKVVEAEIPDIKAEVENILTYTEEHLLTLQKSEKKERAPLIFEDDEELKKWFRPSDVDEIGQNQTFSQGDFLARIIHIHPETKRVGLSLLSHVVCLQPIPFDVGIGMRFAAATIRRVEEKRGIAVTFSTSTFVKSIYDKSKQEDGEEASSDEESVHKKSERNRDEDVVPTPSHFHPVVYRGYIQISRLSDKPKDKISSSHYQIGDSKKVRVVAFSAFDGVVQLSHRKMDWNDPFLRYEDIKPSTRVTCVVKKITARGIVASLTSRIDAFCPRNHASDIYLTDLDSKFKVGTKVKARVLNVNLKKRNVYLTFKNTLVKSDLTLVSSYCSSIKSGSWAHGTVAQVRPFGVIISFYGNVKGVVPVHELGAKVTLPPMPASPTPQYRQAVFELMQKTFTPGQVVKCRIVEVFPNLGRITLSFSNSISETQAQREQSAKYVDNFTIGTYLRNLDVKSRDPEKGLSLKYTDPTTSTNVSVVVPLHHLSDHQTLCKSALDSFKVGAMVPKVLIIAKGKQTMIGTMKQSLIDAHEAGKLPSSFDQVSVGEVYHGYITKIMEGALLVRFLGDFVGLVMRSQIDAPNILMENLKSLFYEGQSVKAQVSTKDTSKMQILLEMKSPQTAPNDCSWLKSYFVDLNNSMFKPKSNINWSSVFVGKVIKCKVLKCEAYGIIAQVLDKDIAKASSEPSLKEATAFVHPSQTQGSSVLNHPVGTEVEAVILDFSPNQGVLDVSLRPELVQLWKSQSKLPSKNDSHYLQAGQIMEATIEYIKVNYLVGLLQTPKPCLINIEFKDFNSAKYLDPFARYKPLQRTKVIISAYSRSGIQLAHLIQEKPSDQPKKSYFVSDTIKSITDVKAGQTGLTGQVLAIRNNHVEITLGGRVKGYLDMTLIDNIEIPANSEMFKYIASFSKQTTTKSKSKSAAKTSLYEELSSLDLPKTNPLSRFTIGQTISGLNVIDLTEHQEDGTYKRVKQANHESAQCKVNLSLIPDSPNRQMKLDWQKLCKGQIVPLWITEITPTAIIGLVGPSMRGYVSALEASHLISKVENLNNIGYSVGQVVLAAITDVDSAKQKVHLSLRALHLEEGVSTSEWNLADGNCSFGKVSSFKYSEHGYGVLKVHLFGKIFGKVGINHLSDDYVSNPMDFWTSKENSFVPCHILDVGDILSISNAPNLARPKKESDSPKNFLRLSLRSSLISTESSTRKLKYPVYSSISDLAPGLEVYGYIVMNNSIKKFAFVQIGDGLIAHLPYSVIGSSYVKDPLKKFPVGTLVKGKIVKLDLEKKRIDFAMREPSAKSSDDLSHLKYEDIKVNSVYKGEIGVIQSFGLFVKLQKSKISALCHVSEINDPLDGEDSKRTEQDRMTLEQLQHRFKVGQKVEVVVIGKEDDKKKVRLSMRPSKLESAEAATYDYTDIKEGEKNASKKGTQQRSQQESGSEDESSDEENGMEVDEYSDDASEDEGLMKALGKSKNLKKRKSKSSEGEESDEDSYDESMQIDSFMKQKTSKSKKIKLEEANSSEDDEHMVLKADDNAIDEAESISEEDSEDYAIANPSNILSSNVEWGDLKFNSNRHKTSATTFSSKMDIDDVIGSSDSEVEEHSDEDTPKDENGIDNSISAKRYKSDREKAEEEMEIAAQERDLLDSDRPLKTDADFERALISSPQSSYVWIRWISQKIYDGDIARARSLAEIAIKRIDERAAPTEKANIWLAYISLEHQHGTRESFQALVKRAAQHSSKPKQVYHHAIAVLLKTGQNKEAEEFYELILKRYKHCLSSWVNYATYRFKNAQPSQARDLLNRSLKSLVARKHLNLLNKFAQLEFQFGDHERGRTVFETLLGNHAKRTDIWFVYIDMEIKYAKSVELARNLYERMITLDMKALKMRPIFKRYLQFELKHGSPSLVEHVRAKAQEYVDQQS